MVGILIVHLFTLRIKLDYIFAKPLILTIKFFVKLSKHLLECSVYILDLWRAFIFSIRIVLVNNGTVWEVLENLNLFFKERLYLLSLHKARFKSFGFFHTEQIKYKGNDYCDHQKIIINCFKSNFTLNV